MPDETIFTQIILEKLPAEKVYENERLIAFKDIHPCAPVHILIVSKKVIPDLQSVSEEDLNIISEIAAVAQKLAVQFGVADGYRLLTNIGKTAGQTIFHLHFHLIGGRELGPLG